MEKKKKKQDKKYASDEWQRCTLAIIIEILVNLRMTLIRRERHAKEVEAQ